MLEQLAEPMRLAASASMATVERPMVKTTAKRESKRFMKISCKNEITLARISKKTPIKKQRKTEINFEKSGIFKHYHAGEIAPFFAVKFAKTLSFFRTKLAIFSE